jgi:transcriptional regulator with XRE-family HTH domain
MEESFGARLRQRREEQGIALDAIAQQTKIKASLLRELERDDLSHWPWGIFRRSFIRSYAQAIGLNPDAVLREFLEVHPEPAEVEAHPAPPAQQADAGGPPSRLREMVGSVFRLRRGPSVEPSPVERTHGPAGEPEPASATLPDAAPADPAPVAAAAPAAETPADPTPSELSPPAAAQPDLAALARLCTELGRLERPEQIRPLLFDAGRVLDAMGLIVWVWEPAAAELRPALAFGYSEKVLAQLPAVKRDADNATAAAFRSTEMCTISGHGHTRGALAVPMLTRAGCAGVLAIELHSGSEQSAPTRAVATILAAVLAQVVGNGRAVEAEPAWLTSMA